MYETSTRLLALLSLLQSRRDWRGAELAERLGVSTRTVRSDVERLRGLGYAIDAVSGPAGGYRLGSGGSAMPPLLLDDDEAVAVAVGLRAAATLGVSGIDETSVGALAKLQQVLPSRLRQRVASLGAAIEPVVVPGPGIDPDVLMLVAGAIRSGERVRFDYTAHGGAESRRDVEPHRLVAWRGRWYLVAWDTGRDDWRTFRLDRCRPVRSALGPRFRPRELAAADAATFVRHGADGAVWRVQARIRFHVSAAVARPRLPAAVTVSPGRTSIMRGFPASSSRPSRRGVALLRCH